MKKIALVFLVALFAGISAAGPLPDTGQTKCYDDVGNEINPCPSTGESQFKPWSNSFENRNNFLRCA